MESNLRKYFFGKYGGFADKRYKNIEKDYPIAIHDFGEYDIKEHVTFITLNVIDDSKLQISFYNNLDNNFPYTNNLISFLENYDGEAKNNLIKIIFEKTDYNLLNILIREFAGYYSKSPNYAWIGPRIVKSLEKLLASLKEYNNI